MSGNTGTSWSSEGCGPVSRRGVSPLKANQTCLNTAGDLSRNRTVGLRIGKGEKLSAVVTSMRAVAEGILTSK